MLSEKQSRCVEALDWFFYGPRASGRTYLACYVAVLHSLKTHSSWTQVLDHYENPDHRNYLLSTLRTVVEKEFGADYILEFKDRPSMSSMVVFRVYRKEELFYAPDIDFEPKKVRRKRK